jgi:DNA uptake protein ComE-like DNA-binding protein
MLHSPLAACLCRREEGYAMNGRFLFLGGVVTLAAVACLARFTRAPESVRPSLVFRTAAPSAVLDHRLIVKHHASRDESGAAVVYVAGEVAHPGVYRLPGNQRVEAAVHAAGGPLGDADLVAVNLAEPLKDGEEIAVPMRGAARPVKRRSGRAHIPHPHAKAQPEPIDINAADAEQLQALPGIGASLNRIT